MKVLGISAFYHDSAAAILENGEIVAAAQEERFSRKKHDRRFPVHAIAYCLKEAGLQLRDLDLIAFYDKPLLKFERLLETYYAFAPKGFRSFASAMPVWIKEKLFLKKLIKEELSSLAKEKYPQDLKIIFPEHHLSHAASAFYPSPYPSAAILTIDGVGEYATTTIGVGMGNNIEILKQINFPHSVGLLYSAFTYYTGFKVNSGEYKVMGLAPYGEPKYVDKIYEHLIDVKEDGSIWLNMEYFDFATGLTMTNEKFHRLFGGPPRKPESLLTQKEMDLAASVQKVVEDVMLKMARYAKKVTKMKYLTLAGGVALNCVANGKILRENIFDDIWIQPAAGDAGGALGAAYVGWHIYFGKERHADGFKDKMQGAYLGPEFTNKEVKRQLKRFNARFVEYDNFEQLAKDVAKLIDEGNVIGWFQGRMEWGPRALGNRSIIGDARNKEMQRKMNLKIKFRESFRPFAPSVLEEDVSEYFEIDRPSPYMLLVAPVRKERRREMTAEEQQLWGIDKLNVIRSDIPAITHVDYSARIQTVNEQVNPRYHKLLKEFKNLTGYGIVVNTSFNVRGEPIVCTPEDAYLCFMRTEMDYLVINDLLFKKGDQPPLRDDIDWRKEFELD